jgi:hypothetical protein
MAALRALTMQTTIHATCAQKNGLRPPREQRTGERERQREHRVAEANERQIGWQAWSSVRKDPRDVGRGDARDQIFFHVPHACRQPHADQRRTLAGFDRA